MNHPNIDQLRTRPLVAVVIVLLLAVALLAGVACGRDAVAPAATPEFSLPTALPSPEAVPTAGAGGEATAAATSGY